MSELQDKKGDKKMITKVQLIKKEDEVLDHVLSCPPELKEMRNGQIVWAMELLNKMGLYGVEELLLLGSLTSERAQMQREEDNDEL